MPENEQQEPGEFTRIFMRQRANAPGGPRPDSNVARESDSSTSTPSPRPAPPPGPATPAAVRSSEADPGEFTQFFGAKRSSEQAATPRVSNATPTPRAPTGVQRPPAPPPRSLRSGDSSTGSFSDHFSPNPQPSRSNADNYGPRKPPIVPEGHSDAFDYKPLAPQLAKEEPSEYTMLFGGGNLASDASRPQPSLVHDPPRLAPPPASARPAPAAAHEIPAPPTEFTTVANGRTSQPMPPTVQASATAAGGMSSPIHISATNPLASMSRGGVSMPHLPMGGGAPSANLQTPLGSVHVQGPQVPGLHLPAAAAPNASKWSDQTKLILLFGILAILAVTLVVWVVATQKS